ncbi:MAG: DNA alkylation repair protein [Bacteroidetes bacterium]|nr:DNA alkylation repair protein [Bacteroidota bacterium]
MQHYQKYHPTLVKKLQAAKVSDKKTGFKDLKKYIGTQYDFIGLSVPKQRELYRTNETIQALSLPKQMRIWQEIWQHSSCYEALAQALFFVLENRECFDAEELFTQTKKWVSRIDNWAHSDALSDLYASLLEKNAELVYPQLKIWNQSKNLWERRQSLVSLLEYSRKRKKVLPANSLFFLIKKLLHDHEYYVQKGVGWTLREVGNVYPNETWIFLQEHYADISSIAFSAAVEKLPATKKEFLKKLRKKSK